MIILSIDCLQSLTNPSPIIYIVKNMILDGRNDVCYLHFPQSPHMCNHTGLCLTISRLSMSRSWRRCNPTVHRYYEEEG